MSDFQETIHENLKWVGNRELSPDANFGIQREIIKMAKLNKEIFVARAITLKDIRYETIDAIRTSAERGLQQLYQQYTGISLQKQDIPELIAIDGRQFRQIQKTYKKQGVNLRRRFYDPINHCAIVSVASKVDLRTVVDVHHELHHGLGQQVIVIKEGALSSGVSGHETSSSFSSGRRGLVLEEGVMEYYGKRFALTSQDPVVVELRRQALAKIKTTKWFKEMGKLAKDRVLIWQQLSGSVTSEYNSASLLIWRILAKALRTSEEQLQLMHKLLLGSRLDGSKKSQLIKGLNELVGEEFGQKVYKIQIDDLEGIKQLVDLI
jgi:hypothetical protein